MRFADPVSVEGALYAALDAAEAKVPRSFTTWKRTESWLLHVSGFASDFDSAR